ncbi:TetR/AcrR family transcriptional regulator [Actinocatenispora sera]|uniref:TetR family transcriptional regulator n=2 Tax=Actinocatenispora sera TaxID=390989 RepID=A0A810KXB5_9ACTN|nr:TetR/AcrR family transcriptional regulator [Actinocatenispora sera]BCJ27325.1 TetR family transcriptional regulator [Actinocatenispora sera]
MAERRPHTGRRRSEEARCAIMSATLRLFTERAATDVTVSAIAASAGVGKQTIYRWWPSKYAILAEALSDLSASRVPQPDTGSVHKDLRRYITATFLGAGSDEVAPLLRALAAQAQNDRQSRSTLRAFGRDRRQALSAILRRGVERGELPAHTSVDLAVDQVFAMLWYRLLIDDGPLSAGVARRLTDALLKQLS